MQAYELTIDARVKSSPFTIVSADDFQFHTGRSIDAHVVLVRPTSTKTHPAENSESSMQTTLFTSSAYFRSVKDE